LLPHARRFFHHHLWCRIFYFTPLVIVPLYPTHSVCVKHLSVPSVLPCARLFKPQISLAKNALFHFSGVNIFLSHSHIMCYTSIWLSYGAMCQVVISYQSSPKIILFNSSCVSFHFANSHSLCSTSIWPFSAAMFHGGFSSQSLTKNTLFNYSCVRSHFAQSRSLCNNTIWPLSAVMCQSLTREHVI